MSLSAPPSRDVSTSANTVTTRLARLASTSSTSLIVRVGSSRYAWAFVVGASMRPMVAQIQMRYTMQAADHPAAAAMPYWPAATTIAATTAPTTPMTT